MSRFANTVALSHDYLADVLRPGDLAVDLTAGNGSDTLFLAQAVGPQGQVVAFDIQQAALDATRQRLQQAGIAPERVTLVHASHDQFDTFVTAAPRAVIANLGYLPGGDKALTTRPETTLSALHQACAALLLGGRIAVVVYTGHPGGADEAAAVDRFFAELPTDNWQVLRIEVLNRQAAPYLLVAERDA